MRGGFGGLFGGLILLLALSCPVVALVGASVVDRVPGQPARVSPFPMALASFDPYVWRCARNSLIVGSAVAAGSLTIGVGLGLLLGRRRFWGRGLLGALIALPLAFGPLWLTPGAIRAIGDESAWRWLAARSTFGVGWDDWARWLAMAWVGMAGGVPVVALATRASLRKVDEGWADAARVLGAGRFRVWRDVTWPTIRGDAIRAASAWFAFTLVDPVAPRLLRLPRTLGWEVAAVARRFEDPTRAATLGLIALAMAWSILVVAGRWAGPIAPELPGDRLSPRVPRASRRMGLFAVMALGAWASVGLGPVVALVAGWLRDAGGIESPESVVGWWRSFVDEARDPSRVGWLINAAVTASIGIAVALVALGLLAGRGRAWVRLVGSVPPLCLAVGALAIPWLVEAGSATWGDAGSARVADEVAAELSTGRGPGWLLAIVLAAIHLPGLARVLGPPGARSGEGPAIDAARLLGVGRRRALRLAEGRRVDLAGLAAIALACAWATTDPAAAYLLTPTPERRTLASAALNALDRDPTGPSTVAGLLVILASVRLVGLALAGLCGRSRPLGGWFRGG